MCGRVTLRTPADAVAEAFGAVLEEGAAAALAPREQVAPTEAVATVRVLAGAGAGRDPGGGSGHGRSLGALRWGLVAPWDADPRAGGKRFNARAETVFTNGLFRGAARERRCLVIVDGYYEWRRLDGRRKQPYLFRARGGGLLALAGIWERSGAPGRDRLETVAVLTTAPNALAAAIHDRMPAVLDPEGCARWLDPAEDAGRLAALLGPCPEDALLAEPVTLGGAQPDKGARTFVFDPRAGSGGGAGAGGRQGTLFDLA